MALLAATSSRGSLTSLASVASQQGIKSICYSNSLSSNSLRRNFFWKSQSAKLLRSRVKKEEPKAYEWLHIPHTVDQQVKGFSALKGEMPLDVMELFEFIKNSKKYDDIGALMPRGILLVGPPGNGKTSIVRALAEETAVPIHAICASNIGTKYSGEGQTKLRELFSKARESAGTKGAIVFIDEIDSLGSRQSMSDGWMIDHRQTLTTLLNEMDGLHREDSLMIIGATNRPADIDSALKRPGRFDRIVKIPNPNLQSRLEIIIFYANRTRYDICSVKLEEIAELTEGWSCAELKNLVNEAAIRAVRSGFAYITKEHYNLALEAIKQRKINSNLPLEALEK
jgi:cell division protease FtsH